MQLVLSGKRVIGYGENLLATGGTVVNLDTEKVYQNATIAECECCPCDIDKVGYEYHNGEFIPCAPYGTGPGNIAVFCDECKTPRDSGFNVGHLGKFFITSYKGVTSTSKSITAPFPPQFVIVVERNKDNTNVAKKRVLIMSAASGVSFTYTGEASALSSVSVSGNTITWKGESSQEAANYGGASSGAYYYDVFIGG